MKKLSIIIFLLFFTSCDSGYKPNFQINNRRPPVTIIAIDKSTKSVVMRDGDNHVFTIYDNPTTSAIVSSLKVNDTIRLSSRSIKKKF